MRRATRVVAGRCDHDIISHSVSVMLLQAGGPVR